MGRPSGPKTRCGGLWTEAKFNSFIKNTLRAATQRWGPKSVAKSKARVSRGFYKCAECEETITATIKNEKGRRVKNAIVDHIIPIIDPAVGFTTWGECIERMFCEVEGLQVLCLKCHTVKSNEERRIAADRRKSETS